MGSLAGHVIPGVFFIIHGFWWCANSIWFHVNSAKKLQKDVTASNGEDSRQGKSPLLSAGDMQVYKLSRMSWLPAPFLPRIPLEPVLKIFFCSLGLFVEEFLTYDENHHVRLFVYHIRKPDGTLSGLSKFYHIILYFGFALSGVVDLYSLCVKKIPAPTSTIFLSLSFFVEGLLFYYHTIGRPPFNTIVHILLIFCIISCFIFTLMRLYSPVNVVINLGLGCSILLQGTWFIQIGYFLFGNFLSKDEIVTEEHVEMAVACFAWHLFILSLSMLPLLTLVSVCTNKKGHILRRSRNEGQNCLRKKVYQSEEYSKLIAPEALDETKGSTEMKIVNELLL